MSDELRGAGAADSVHMPLDQSRQIGNLSLRLVQACMESGLRWDDAVIACGVASKALAMHALRSGEGTIAECTARLQIQLAHGIAQTASVMHAWF